MASYWMNFWYAVLLVARYNHEAAHSSSSYNTIECASLYKLCVYKWSYPKKKSYIKLTYIVAWKRAIEGTFSIICSLKILSKIKELWFKKKNYSNINNINSNPNKFWTFSEVHFFWPVWLCWAGAANIGGRFSWKPLRMRPWQLQSRLQSLFRACSYWSCRVSLVSSCSRVGPNNCGRLLGLPP